MSLSARVVTAPAGPVHGTPCSIGALRAELPPDEQAALDRMLWDLGWADSQTFAALSDEGHVVGLQQIGKHRRGQCRCGKQSA